MDFDLGKGAPQALRYEAVWKVGAEGLDPRWIAGIRAASKEIACAELPLGAFRGEPAKKAHICVAQDGSVLIDVRSQTPEGGEAQEWAAMLAPQSQGGAEAFAEALRGAAEWVGPSKKKE